MLLPPSLLIEAASNPLMFAEANDFTSLATIVPAVIHYADGH
jgi:hypothetical protein